MILIYSMFSSDSLGTTDLQDDKFTLVLGSSVQSKSVYNGIIDSIIIIIIIISSIQTLNRLSTGCTVAKSTLNWKKGREREKLATEKSNEYRRGRKRDALENDDDLPFVVVPPAIRHQTSSSPPSVILSPEIYKSGKGTQPEIISIVRLLAVVLSLIVTLFSNSIAFIYLSIHLFEIFYQHWLICIINIILIV